MILVPVLFTLKMLGIDLEKIKSWLSSGDGRGRVSSSKPRRTKFIKPFEPSRSSSISYRHLPSNIHYKR